MSLWLISIVLILGSVGSIDEADDQFNALIAAMKSNDPAVTEGWQRFIETHTGHPLTPLAGLNRASCLSLAGLHKQAGVQAESGLASLPAASPEQVAALAQTGRVRLAEGRATNSKEALTAALAHFDDVITKAKGQPEETDALLARGELLDLCGRPNESETALKEWLLTNAGHPRIDEARLALANASLHAKHPKNVLETTVLVTSGPSASWARVAAAQAHESLGQVDEAIADLDAIARAIQNLNAEDAKSQPQTDCVQYERGRLFESKSTISEAITAYDLAAKGTSAVAMQSLIRASELRQAAGAHDRAILGFRDAIGRKPDSKTEEELGYCLAWSQLETKDAPGAIATLNKHRPKDPVGLARNLLLESECEKRIGDWAAAAATFGKLADLEQGARKARFLISAGEASIQSGKPPTHAIDNYRRATEASPSSIEGVEAFVGLGRIYLEAGQLVEAETAFGSALTVKSGSEPEAAARHLKAEVLARRGKPVEAAEAMIRAAGVDARYPIWAARDWAAAAAIFRKTGRAERAKLCFEQAVETYRQALAANPKDVGIRDELNLLLRK
jgi:tetratricopeptide (TPR) repeat protein